MVCRTHPLGTVAIGLAKRQAGLDDAQLQSIVHQLRHQGTAVPADQAKWLQTSLRTKLQLAVDHDPTIKPQRRAGLQRRLTTALNQPLEPALAWALHQLPGTALRAQHALAWRLAAHAARRGQTIAEISAEFHLLRSQAPRGRQPRATWDERATTWGTPQDPATRYAFDQLQQASTGGQGGPIGHRIVADHPHQIPGYPSFRFGYDPVSRRLELLHPDGTLAPFRLVPPSLADTLTTVDAPHALSTLSTTAAHQVRSQVGAESDGYALRCPTCGRPAPAAHPCATAGPVLAGGQLVHVARGATTLRTIAADDIRHLLAAGHTVELPFHVTCGTGHIVIDATDRRDIQQRTPGPGVVDGTAFIAPTPQPTITFDRTECSCMTFHETHDCDHRFIAHDVLETHLGAQSNQADHAQSESTGPATLPLPAGQPPAGANGQPTGHATTPQLPAGSATNRPGARRLDASTWNYSEDPLRFAADCRAALARRGDEHGGVPYLTDSPAIYGYGDNRPFRVEIEYSAPNPIAPDTYQHLGYTDHHTDHHTDTWADSTGEHAVQYAGAIGEDDLPGLEAGEITASRYIAGRGWVHGYRQVPVDATGDPASPPEILNARIGQALHRHGIIDDPVIQDYRPTTDGDPSRPCWTLEASATADGRAVSPIQVETPGMWSDLAVICGHITGYGGAPAMAGTYVTVAVPDLAANPEALANLQRFLIVWEDDFYRMASNPHTPSRITRFCRPLQDPPALGFSPATDAADALAAKTHTSMVSFSGLQPTGPDASHLQFRLFDGSLQPGRIQAQIKLALAATDFATHHAISPLEPRVRLGSGDTRQRVLRSAAEWFDPITTGGIRRLIDRLFCRDEDKQQIAALWAVSNYQTNPLAEAP